MGVVGAGIMADDDLAPGHLEIDADLEQVALKPARMSALDDDMAGRDAGEEALQLFDALAKARFERRRGGHVPERDPKRELHRYFPLLHASKTTPLIAAQN